MLLRFRCQWVEKRSRNRENLVGVAGFEPATPCSRSRCATRLRYTPSAEADVYRREPRRPQEKAPLQGPADLARRCPWLGLLLGGRPLIIVFVIILSVWAWPNFGQAHWANHRQRNGAWPSGKATGFGPVILGSNPSAPATLSISYRPILRPVGTGQVRGRIPRLFRVLGFRF
jgi:hypothetical protein